jgi:hypothetical protein
VAGETVQGCDRGDAPEVSIDLLRSTLSQLYHRGWICCAGKRRWSAFREYWTTPESLERKAVHSLCAEVRGLLSRYGVESEVRRVPAWKTPGDIGVTIRGDSLGDLKALLRRLG